VFGLPLGNPFQLQEIRCQHLVDGIEIAAPQQMPTGGKTGGAPTAPALFRLEVFCLG